MHSFSVPQAEIYAPATHALPAYPCHVTVHKLPHPELCGRTFVRLLHAAHVCPAAHAQLRSNQAEVDSKQMLANPFMSADHLANHHALLGASCWGGGRGAARALPGRPWLHQSTLRIDWHALSCAGASRIVDRCNNSLAHKNDDPGEQNCLLVPRLLYLPVLLPCCACR